MSTKKPTKKVKKLIISIVSLISVIVLPIVCKDNIELKQGINAVINTALNAVLAIEPETPDSTIIF